MVLAVPSPLADDGSSFHGAVLVVACPACRPANPSVRVAVALGLPPSFWLHGRDWAVSRSCRLPAGCRAFYALRRSPSRRLGLPSARAGDALAWTLAIGVECTPIASSPGCRPGRIGHGHCWPPSSASSGSGSRPSAPYPAPECNDLATFWSSDRRSRSDKCYPGDAGSRRGCISASTSTIRAAWSHRAGPTDAKRGVVGAVPPNS